MHQPVRLDRKRLLGFDRGIGRAMLSTKNGNPVPPLGMTGIKNGATPRPGR
jgi:hypothetical protein